MEIMMDFWMLRMFVQLCAHVRWKSLTSRHKCFLKVYAAVDHFGDDTACDFLPRVSLSYSHAVTAVSDIDHDHKVSRHEFAHFIFHMAAADLVHQQTDPGPPKVSMHISITY